MFTSVRWAHCCRVRLAASQEGGGRVMTPHPAHRSTPGTHLTPGPQHGSHTAWVTCIMYTPAFWSHHRVLRAHASLTRFSQTVSHYSRFADKQTESCVICLRSAQDTAQCSHPGRLTHTPVGTGPSAVPHRPALGGRLDREP